MVEDRTARRVAVSDAGFTLIELIVAMVVLGAMSMAVIGVIMSTQAQGVGNRARVAAASLASREMDLVREQFADADGPVALANEGTVVNQNPINGGTIGQPLLVDGTLYTVTRLAEWNFTGTGVSACDGGSLVRFPTMLVTVTITWPKMGQTKPVVETASMAPAKKTGIQSTSSFIASKVVDQASMPLANISVKATGGGVTVMDTTDPSGCAVIQVAPAAAGTTYSIQVNDASYIDLAGTVYPSKSSGLLTPGTLYSNAKFTIARPGSVTLHLSRADGVALTDAQVAGSTVTLVASEFSGASGESPKVVAGRTTVLTGLWPTTYGGYFGTAAPAGGYSVKTLPPGGAITLEVSFELAATSVDNLPPTSTTVYAFPAGTVPPATCAGAVATAAASGDSAALSLLPGTYDLYASGSAFTCSRGPVGVALASGTNGPVEWLDSTLILTGVPMPANTKVWAIGVSTSGITVAPTTCPTTYSGTAQDITAAASTGQVMAAGAWYVWSTTGTNPKVGCQSYPTATNQAGVSYGTTVSRPWSLGSVNVRVTNVPTGNQSFFAITTSTTVPTCSAMLATPTPELVAGPATGSTSTAPLSLALPRPATGTTRYNAYIWKKVASGGGCQMTSIGYFTVGQSNFPPDKTVSSTGESR
jgi:prepilin-type N-terminal cleavage/methylation domain-containing protein